MTRMADPERPRDDHEYDDERFEDEGRSSIFSALWFRAILVVIVLGAIVYASLASANNTSIGSSASKSDDALTIMGFGTGDDVAETRAALATKAVGGSISRPSGSAIARRPLIVL